MRSAFKIFGLILLSVTFVLGTGELVAAKKRRRILKSPQRKMPF